MVRMDKLYVTPAEIRRLMNVNADEYPDDMLIPLIEEAMGVVDTFTGTVWNGRCMEVEEVLDISRYKAGIIYGAGIWLELAFWPIKSIEHIWVFQGTGYIDWVKSYPCDDPIGNGRGRCMWWYVPETGKLFLQSYVLKWGGYEVRVVYRFGRDDLDPRVKRFVRLYVERELLRQEMTVMAVPEMSKGIGLSVKDRIKLIDQMLNELRLQLFGYKMAGAIRYKKEVDC